MLDNDGLCLRPCTCRTDNTTMQAYEVPRSAQDTDSWRRCVESTREAQKSGLGPEGGTSEVMKTMLRFVSAVIRT